jgi:hypothetical protein
MLFMLVRSLTGRYTASGKATRLREVNRRGRAKG